MRISGIILPLILCIQSAAFTQCISGDCADGIGTFLYQNGDMYTGQWSDTLKSGYGRYDWSDGSYYVGNWKSDLMDGDGIYHGTDGTNLKGHFEKGQYTPPTGCIEGDCKNGKGTFYFPNGDQYSGDWVNGMRTGVGRYEWANGSYYEGQFLNNNLHGEGAYHSFTGSSKIGRFENNNYIFGSEPKTKTDTASTNAKLGGLQKTHSAATQKDFCSVVREVVHSYPAQFESITGDRQVGSQNSETTWFTTTIVENSVESGITSDSSRNEKTFYNILFKSADSAAARNKYFEYVQLMNNCTIDCCTLVSDTNHNNSGQHQSEMTYWLSFLVSDKTQMEAYQKMVIEIEMMRDVSEPGWSVVLRVYRVQKEK